jgi:hypothetical protein
MPGPASDTPEAPDTATATAMQARREKLLRIAEGRTIRIRVAYARTACVAICAVGALLAGDRLAATIQAIEAYMLIGFVFFRRKSGSKEGSP